jgi:hypothetical protein
MYKIQNEIRFSSYLAKTETNKKDHFLNYSIRLVHLLTGEFSQINPLHRINYIKNIQVTKTHHNNAHYKNHSQKCKTNQNRKQSNLHSYSYRAPQHLASHMLSYSTLQHSKMNCLLHFQTLNIRDRKIRIIQQF